MLSYHYANGRVSGIDLGGVPLIGSVLHDPENRVTGWLAAGGAQVLRSYDLNGRLSAFSFDGGQATVSYDADGRVVALDTDSFGYDGLSRLVSYAGFSGNRAYLYDAVGNRTALTAGYNAANRKVSADNGLDTWRYTYNGLGQRVHKARDGDPATTRLFRYDTQARLLGEYLSDGTPVLEPVYLGHLPVALITPAGSYTVQADHLATPRAVVDAAGVTLWRWYSEPFGDTLPEEDPDGDGVAFTLNLRFPGQYFDAETGTHYNYRRDYDPATGRYAQLMPWFRGAEVCPLTWRVY